MSDTDVGAESSKTLAEFFAATMQPETSTSLFTPDDVAELIRCDRNAAE